MTITGKILFNGGSSLDWAVAKLKMMDKFIEGNCDSIIRHNETFEIPEPVVDTYTTDEEARLVALSEQAYNEGLALINEGFLLPEPTYNANEARKGRASLEQARVKERNKIRSESTQRTEKFINAHKAWEDKRKIHSEKVF